MTEYLFDLWKKDVFFDAAEAVQESADVMESAYRKWLRARRDGSPDNNGVSCELQTTLGTAKWQLEEFARAVGVSKGHIPDDITSSRHMQFIEAIENQISRVEMSIVELLNKEGKQPLRWVILDKQECDDLADFLSRAQNVVTKKKSDPNEGNEEPKLTSCERGGPEKKDDVIIDVDEKDHNESMIGTICQSQKINGVRRNRSSSNLGSLKITVADEDEEHRKLLHGFELSPKEKRPTSFSWKQRSRMHVLSIGAPNAFKAFDVVDWIHWLLSTPLHLQISCSIHLKLALMLFLCIVVPFWFYAT